MLSAEEQARVIISRIKSRREYLGYTYQDLSDRTGLSKSTLQRYETGAILSIPLNKIETLASALHTTPTYLMGWSDNPNSQNPYIGCWNEGTNATTEVAEFLTLLKEISDEELYGLRVESKMQYFIHSPDLIPLDNLQMFKLFREIKAECKGNGKSLADGIREWFGNAAITMPEFLVDYQHQNDIRNRCKLDRNIATNFSERLQNLRWDRGLSREALAEKLDTTEKNIADYEIGIARNIPLSRIEQLANALQTIPSYFMKGNAYKEPLDSCFCKTFDPYFYGPYNFGSLIGRRRIELGIELKDMSADLGITKKDLDEIESGILSIDEEWAKMLSSYLNTSISQLLYDYKLYDGDVPEEWQTRVDEWEKLQNKDAQNSDVECKEAELLQKYRALDDYGIEIIDFILNKEYERCASTK